MSRGKHNLGAKTPGAAPPSNRRVTRRAAMVLGMQLMLGGALAWRMRQLQVVETERYRLLAEENRINMRLIAPARAQIFDRNGKPLAVNTKNYRVVMIREQTNDAEETLNDLGKLVEIPDHQRRRVMKDLRSKSAFVPVAVAEHLTWNEFSRINANAPALPGIQPEVGLSRHYPHGDLTAHVVGYVGRVTKRDLEKLETVDPVLQIPEFQIGKSGVEKAAEGDLRGEAGSRQIEVNALGRVIRELDRTEGLTGRDLHLTLDLELQDAVLKRLNEESAAAVLMDLRDGDLLALASSPTYDPNPFVLGISQNQYSALLEDDHRPLHNKWASGMYPPGSTFKMVVALAALEANVIGPGESVFCPGFMKLGNRRFHCWRSGGHGHLNLEQALEQSCDVYFYEIAKRTGIDKIAEMANRLSLGTDIELPVTAMRAGLMPTKAWKRQAKEVEWQLGDTLNAGIGQGFVLATPLQLAVMTGRIATGRMIQPRLIRARAGQPEPVISDQDLGINPRHLELVRRGMYSVVNSKRGTARRSRISDDENAMAGKTGTSQVRNITAAERARGVFKNKDLPWRRRDHALFVAYAPYDNPRYALSVIVEHGGGGSTAAAPIARDIMMRALYGPEPPDRAYPSGKAPKPAPDTPSTRIPT
ncbi:penicillin-binding protein 2 [Rhodobacteraceae bacterium NNCM2]|nr:penicillin-binding protein 2 [Coraliihabitans acroporae]